jgi:hypothetical protein
MGTGSGFPTQVYRPCDIQARSPGRGFSFQTSALRPSMQPQGAQDKELRRKISDLGLVEPALSWPDPRAQGGEVPGPAGGRIVREEIKCDHGVDLPRCDELAQRHGGFSACNLIKPPSEEALGGASADNIVCERKGQPRTPDTPRW